MVYVYIKTDVQVPVIPNADACLNAIELTWNDTLTISAGDTTWYMLPLAEAKALGKDLELTVSNNSGSAANVYVAVSEQCPVVSFLTERTGSVPAKTTLSKKLLNSELISLADTVYFLLSSTQDLTIVAATDESDLPSCEDVVVSDTIVACDKYKWNGAVYTQSGDYTYALPASTPEDAEFLDWTQALKLSELTEPWYKVDVTDVIVNKADFQLTLHNDLGTALEYTLQLYDGKVELMGEITKTVEPGTISETITYADFVNKIGTEFNTLYLRNVNYDCDRIEKLHLTINKSVEVEYTVDTCGTYKWNGRTYTAPFSGSDTKWLRQRRDSQLDIDRVPSSRRSM